MFSTDYYDVLDKIDAIDPIAYAKNRNFADGAITELSPYISRGIISTKQVMQALFERGYQFEEVEKFIQELAWRDYWQQIWIAKGELIDEDLKSEQKDVAHYEVSTALLNAATGIDVVDENIRTLYQTGYIHNHMRMYIAAIACNQGKNHWKKPAQWMYYHLLDGDWASNALSWQWVAGSNSNKKYIANQENINKYFYSFQQDTFLDLSYDQLAVLDCPDKLKEKSDLTFKTVLPPQESIEIRPSIPTLIYNYYNIDPNWRAEQDTNRVLLLEPSVFEKYPVAQKNIEFILAIAANIKNIQVFVGEFDELVRLYPNQVIYYKEHPLNKHYEGVEDPREWMSSVKGYFPSFFGFWKKVKKEIKTQL